MSNFVIYTISAYETSAELFFGKLSLWKIDLLLDVRLKNQSQLCGFTKKTDLAYLVPRLCSAQYIHDVRLAPSAELLDKYIKHSISWEEYSQSYKGELNKQNILADFAGRYGAYKRICLLGTAVKSRRSHTEVLSEMLNDLD